LPVNQDRLTRLREFGLSEYAARSYLALLGLGIAEARDVSSLSKVPQAKIYHVLEQLHDKGLVVILPEFPKKYAPVPFDEYLSRLHDGHTKAAQSIEVEREALAELFRVMGDTERGDRGFFTVIRGRRNVLARIEEMIAQTQKDLLVLGTAGTAGRAQHMLAGLRRARERQVRVRVLAPLDRETLETLAPLSEVSELRARELGEADQSAKVAIVMSDSTRAFLVHFVPDDNNVLVGKDIGVFTDQEAMVAAIQVIVEPHWARAGTYESRRDEFIHGRAAEFTRVYSSPTEVRKAIEQALASGAEDMCKLNGFDLGEDPGKVGSWRAIYDLPDADAIEKWAKVLAQHKTVEVRHLRTPTLSRQVTIDEREAFFGLAGDVVIHTNAPPVVKALRAQFETLWALSADLEERRRELEVFPGMQPGDVGIGRLFYNLRDAVILVDPSDRIALWNGSASATFARKDVRDVSLPGLVAHDARPDFLDRLARFRKRKETETDFFETEGVRAGGQRFPMEVTLSMLRTTTRGPYIVAVARDITARNDSQLAQSAADARARHAYERMPDAFYALDKDFRFVYRNPAVKALQGKRKDEEIDGHIVWEVFPDLVGTSFESELRRAAHEKRHVRFEEHYPRMGMWFEVNAYPSDDGLSVYFRNVTDTRRAQDAARDSAALLSATLDAVPDGILVVSKDGKITSHNRKFREIWKVPEDLLRQGDDANALAFVAQQLADPEAFRARSDLVDALSEMERSDTLHFTDGRAVECISKPQRVEGRTVGRVWSFRETK
jgi:PAS domain S-box-containing protein